MSGVIVIGSGIAGLCAAKAALEAGEKDVTVVSAFPIGCTQIAAWGAIRNKGVNSKNIFDSIMEYGKGLSDIRILRRFAEKLPEALNFVEGIATLVPAPNVGYKIVGGGAGISRTLLKHVQQIGGRFVNAECTAINTENNIVKSITLFDGNKNVTVAVKAVVLACGGGSSLFSLSDNPITQKGSGYALALKAGAVLRDMEFQVYHPMAQEMSTSKTVCYRMLEMFKLDKCNVMDSEGKRIYEIEELLKSHCSHNQLSEMAFMIHKYKSIFVDIKGKKIPVRPVVHFFLGGVATNEEACTNVQGLYACGEVAGGLNGANRLAGTAFPEAIIFGKIAGRNASAYSKECVESDAQTEQWKESCCYNPELDEFRISSVARILDENLLFIKDSNGIRKAFDIFHNMRKSIEECSENNQLRRRNEALVAEAMAFSALMREESRGTFLRSDFTTESKLLSKSTFIKLEKDELITFQ